MTASFEKVETQRETFYRHLRNAKSRADDVDAVYERPREEFDRIDQTTVEARDDDWGTIQVSFW